MRPIIRQNPDPLPLPDFRNMGTILRVLLAVNGVVAIAAWLWWTTPPANPLQNVYGVM